MRYYPGRIARAHLNGTYDIDRNFVYHNMTLDTPLRISEVNYHDVCRKWNVGVHCPGGCGNAHRCVFCYGEHPVKDCQDRDDAYRRTYGGGSRRITA